MKKLLAAMVLAVASPAVMAVDATPFFSVYVGGGSWKADFSGGLGDFDTDLEELGFDEESNGFFYAAFEHAVPLIPQVRLERTNVSSSGSGTLTGSFSIGDETFTVGTDVASEFDLTLTDAVLYYELLMFDFGLTLRQFDAEAAAVSATLSDSEEVDGVLPMVYLQAKVDLPFTGFYATGSANAISYDDKSVTDFRAAVGYAFDISILAEIGAELGYRSLEIDLGDEEDFTGDIELSGAYFGLNVKF